VLSEPRESPGRAGCALALFLIGLCFLSFVGAWVVTVRLFEWFT